MAPFTFKSGLFTLSMVTLSIVTAISSAHAQFALQAGTNKGILELASRNTVAGGAGTIYRNDGLMLEAGGGFPAITTVNTGVANTGLIAISQNPAAPTAVASGAVGNYGGGNASLFATQGATAGVFTNDFSVSDNNPVAVPGVASETAMYGQGAWTYTGNAPIIVAVGAFLTMSANIKNVNGSYVEAGVDSLVSINGVAQAAPQIAFAFDGVGGPLASFISAGSYQYNVTSPTSVTFSAQSFGFFQLQPNDTISVQGTLTAFGDPASVTFLSGPNNDTSIIATPESSSLFLLVGTILPALAGIIIVRRKQRQA